MKFICGLAIGLICAFCNHVYHEVIALNYVQKITELDGQLSDEKETVNNLLSNGRWILSWDQKLGKKTYRFKSNVTDDYRPNLVAKQ